VCNHSVGPLRQGDEAGAMLRAIGFVVNIPWRFPEPGFGKQCRAKIQLVN
jgi:hypothetical protein